MSAAQAISVSSRSGRRSASTHQQVEHCRRRQRLGRAITARCQRAASRAASRQSSGHLEALRIRASATRTLRCSMRDVPRPAARRDAPCRGRAPAPRSATAARVAAPPPSRAQRAVNAPVSTRVMRGGCGRHTARRLRGSSAASAPQARSTASMRDGCASMSPRASSCHTRSGASVASSPDATMLAHQR